MIKKIGFAGLGLLLLASPLFTSALNACPSVSLSLYRKPASATTQAERTQITSLQNFLIAEGYLEAGYATGNFGALTEAAVGSWQIAHAVVSASDDGDSDAGWGTVGPRTRTAIAAACGGTDGETTSATPAASTDGAYALSTRPASDAATNKTIIFTTIIGPAAGCVAGAAYTLEYGDGTFDTRTYVCGVSGSWTHAYTQNGSYITTLYLGTREQVQAGSAGHLRGP